MKNLNKHLGPFFRKYWPFLSAFVIVLIFFWKVIFLNKVLLPADNIVGRYYPWLDYSWGYSEGVPIKNPVVEDPVLFSFPMHMLGVDLIKSIRLPLWNSYIFTGTPLFANFQSSAFSLTNFVYLIFDNLTAWNMQVILQHLFVVVFTYLLLRNWKISKIGSLIGGVVFSFTGFNLIWSQWNYIVLTASFIPLLLLFEDKWLATGKWKYGAGLSLIIFFQIVSGYPQVVIYTAIAVFILWLLRFEKKKEFFIKSFFLGFFFLLGLGLSAVQILPGIELLSFSQRGIALRPSEWRFLPWSKVITFLAPDYFGNHSTSNWWGPQNYLSNTGYVGVIATVLATQAVLVFKKRKEILLAMLLIIIGLLLSFPTPLAAYVWKSGIFASQAAAAYRAHVLFTFGVALLSAFGVDHLLSSKKISFKSFLIPFVVLAGFGIFALSMFFLSAKLPENYSSLIKGVPGYKIALENLIFPFIILIAAAFLWRVIKYKKNLSRKLVVAGVFVLLILELFRFGWRYTPFSSRDMVFSETPVLSYLMSQEKPFRIAAGSVIPMNMHIPYRLESLEGYGAMYPIRISELIAAINNGRANVGPEEVYAEIKDYASPLLDMVNTKYFLTTKADKEGNPSMEGEISSEFKLEKFSLVFEDKTVVVLENKNAYPRAFMVYDWQVVKDQHELLNKLLEKDYDFSKNVLLEENVKIQKPDQANVSKPSVNYRKYSEQESVLEVATSSVGLLFISDTWFPGWKVYVDDEEVEIHLANYAFRAVEIPEGKHTIKFVYQPRSFLDGLRVTMISIIVLILSPLYLNRVLGKEEKESYT